MVFVILLMCVTVSTGVSTATTTGWTTPDWKGRSVEITPFDLKVMSSGLYEIDAETGPEAPADEVHSIEKIFERAMTFRYRQDSVDDRWQNPEDTERLGEGDCEDIAVWLYRELRRNGYRNVRVMVGKFEEKDAAYHAWAVCSAPDGDDWIVDPALQRRLWKRSELSFELYRPIYSFDGRSKFAHSS